jgi:peptidoglycan/LPS O-acetylase OafA/YrhL
MVPDVPIAQIGTTITLVLSFLLSMALEMVPGLHAWWEKYAYKQQVWIGSGVLLVLAALGLNALGAINLHLPVPFWWDGFWAVLFPTLAWIAGGQTTYTGLKVAGLVTRTAKGDAA